MHASAMSRVVACRDSPKALAARAAVSEGPAPARPRKSMLSDQKQQIIELFRNALQPLLDNTANVPTITLERPRDPSHGDVACNLAMQLAKPMKKNPRELAQAIVDGLQREDGLHAAYKDGHPAVTARYNRASLLASRVGARANRIKSASTHQAEDHLLHSGVPVQLVI